MQDTETDDKSNKGWALMKTDKKYRKPKIQNPEWKKLKQEEKTKLTNHDDEWQRTGWTRGHHPFRCDGSQQRAQV